MLYTCKNCHQEYEADQERTDALCDSCRALPDWKAPLYDYALKQGVGSANVDLLIDLYTRLGSYRDCAERLEKAQQKKKAAYDKTVYDALRATQVSIVEQAIQTLDRMGDYLEAKQMKQKGEEHLKALQEQQRLEAEERARQEAAQKRKKLLIKLAVAAVLAAAFVVWAFVLPPKNLTKADEAMAAGNYAEAVALYQKAARFSTKEAANEGLENARCEWVASLLEEGKVDEAYGIIQLVEDSGKNNALLLAYAEALLDAGRTDDAYTTLRSMRGSDGRDELLARCGQMQMEAGDYAAAATTFKKMDDDENYRIARRALAQEQLAEGLYGSALSILSDLEDEEAIAQAAELFARSQQEQGQYHDALETCNKYDLLETGNEILREWIAASMEAGDYQAALDTCTDYDRPDVADEVLAAWADVLLAENNYAEALAKREQMQPSEEASARTAELWLTFARMQADEVLAGEMNAEAARLAGEALTNIDAQLYFCHALHNAGYSMSEVYPEGVLVTNTPLYQYHLEDTEDLILAPETNKILVFERHEKPYGALNISIPGLQSLTVSPHSRQNDAIYNIRLLPGWMFDQPTTEAPESWDDACGMIVLDGIYIHSGDITVENYEYTYRNGSTTRSRLIGTTEHPFFDSVNALTFFDKDDTTSRFSWLINTDEPLCADDEWFNANDDDEDTVLLIANRLGTLDFAPLYEDLPSFITFLSMFISE